ncbi:MAG: DNA polymerase III subunit beta [Candidatus Paceibacterota bacterium]
MKIIILKSNLLEGLNSVEKSVSKNQNFPILRNIKIEVNKEDSNIKITSTDLEIAITRTITGKIISEGNVLVPFFVLNRIIKNLNSEKINLEVKNNKLLINSDNYEGSINCEKIEDYPIIPEIQNNKEYLKLKNSDLIESLSETLIATNYSDIRPEINGVYIKYDGKDLFMAGTDGFRLVEKVLQERYINSNFKEIETVIPLKTIENIIRTLDEDDEIEILIDDNQVLFKNKKIKIISRLVDGKFPDYKAVIPTEKNTEITINKNELESAIKITSSFSGKANDISLKIMDKGKILEISSSESTLGENRYRAPIKTKGDKKDIELIFNWKYLKDGLSIFKNEEVVLGINEPTKAMSINSDNNNLIYVVMPIRG